MFPEGRLQGGGKSGTDKKQFENSPSVIQAVKKMFEDNAELHQKMEELMKEKLSAFVDKLLVEFSYDEKVTVHPAEVMLPADHFRDLAFMLRSRVRNIALVLGSKNDGKVNMAVVLGDDVVAAGVNASNIVREAAKEIHGGGGGQPVFSIGGGKRPGGPGAAMGKGKKLGFGKVGH